MKERRIDIIRMEATKLFLRQGYAKTQISHIAKAAAGDGLRIIYEREKKS